MIALLGFITVCSAVVLIMKKVMEPVPSLILVPTITGLLGGFGLDTFKFIVKGLISVAPMGTMFIFATLFFGIIIDAGTVKPIIRMIFRLVGRDPVKICVGTGILAMMVHMDGNGAVTFLIAVPAMMPLYDALGMRRTTLATIIALSAGLMNTEPWAGTAQRAMVSLHLTPADLWTPLLIPLIVGGICILAVDYYLGVCERKRIGEINLAGGSLEFQDMDTEEEKRFVRPKLAPVNMLLVVITIGSLISDKIPPVVAFMLALSVALLINYPKVKDQKDIMNKHAKNALLMAGIVFATGALVGVMSNTGMITAMANAIVSVVPTSLGQHMALFVGIIGMPASLLFDPSSFYFGVLPVLAEAGVSYGVPAVEVARAAFLGQMNMGFPISPLTGGTFLLVALAGIDLGEHQKKTFPWAFGITLIMLAVSIAIGVVSA
ncbi:citrate:proton symporter [Megasphaera paucivorans]|uniref:Citrate-Mg2+:H+ or citrate-Ca2+:H+ symporter, CitMHS family n=1 Tax=Megasphaera paucivorans TaxID=349095 RepID=A0A1G9R544_9FIRM|nr:citrate:proton symporter [Megasphaera paucivorans]SDM18364.1 citrate-Mg2+:H+ or citrate-Ca2+:H+ symporter, CitMHS family [Megasphaera paucivorans]